MTCRPIIQSVTSPITTTYRKRLLAAFAQVQQTKFDNDPEELINPCDSNDGTASPIAVDHILYHEEYRFLKQVSTLSSSPQRLCHVSAMTQCCTIQEIYAIRDSYDEAAKQLHTIMSNPTMDGNTKHQMHCQHRYNYGRQPFVCKGCWSYLPICICHKQQQADAPITAFDNSHTNHTDDSIFQRVPRLPLPSLHHPLLTASASSRINDFDIIDIVMWTHHKEWGSPSNTGSVLPVALKHLYSRNDSISNQPCSVRGYMLMKGYHEHDDQLVQLLRPRHDEEIVIPVVLWAPAANDKSNSNSIITSPTATIIEDRSYAAISNDDCNIKSQQEKQATSATPKRQFVSVDELLHDLHRTRTRLNDAHDENTSVLVKRSQTQTTIRLVMIAVEGTWNQAKRMVTKLPNHVRALHLSDVELFQWRTLLPLSLSCPTTKNECDNSAKVHIENKTKDKVRIHGAVSILDPLRKQKTLNRYPSKKEKQNENMEIGKDSSNDVASKVINTNKVCTVEAVVSALVALFAIPIPDGDYIINLADQKVIRTVTIQGKMTLRNVISHW